MALTTGDGYCTEHSEAAKKKKKKATYFKNLSRVGLMSRIIFNLSSPWVHVQIGAMICEFYIIHIFCIHLSFPPPDPLCLSLALSCLGSCKSLLLNFLSSSLTSFTLLADLLSHSIDRIMSFRYPKCWISTE